MLGTGTEAMEIREGNRRCQLYLPLFLLIPPISLSTKHQNKTKTHRKKKGKKLSLSAMLTTEVVNTELGYLFPKQATNESCMLGSKVVKCPTQS